MIQARLYLLGGGDIVTLALQSSGFPAEQVNTVYRSTDGGKTWKSLNDGSLGEASGGVKGLCFSPETPGTLYIGCNNGVFLSENNGQTWRDIGETLGYRNTAGLVIGADGKTLYAPMLGGGMYAGIVGDGGTVRWQSESALRLYINHIQVLVDPERSNVLYASAYPGGVFKSVDGGETFTEQNFGLPSFKVADPLRQGYYAMQLAPSNPETIYLGIYGKGVYVSKDGAGTWIAVSGEDCGMRSKGIYSLAVDPSDPDTVTVAAEDGVFRTTDGGAGWKPLSNGLPDNIQVRILVTGADGELFAGTLGYEVFWFEAATNSWEQLNAFSCFGVFWPIWNERPLYQYSFLLFNPLDPDLVLIGTFPAGIFRSTDGGRNLFGEQRELVLRRGVQPGVPPGGQQHHLRRHLQRAEPLAGPGAFMGNVGYRMAGRAVGVFHQFRSGRSKHHVRLLQKRRKRGHGHGGLRRHRNEIDRRRRKLVPDHGGAGLRAGVL